MPTRRSTLQLLAATAASSCLPATAEEQAVFPIGACDWSIKKQQDIAAFDVAKSIGLEGLQVSFSAPGSNFDLRDQKVREQYYRKVDETGIQIASLGMGILNQVPLATHPDAIRWVGDAIDVIAATEREQPDKATHICLLAFFGKGDINGRPELMESVIQKLKTVITKAEDAGVVLGIESYLSADDHLKIIEGVGSEAIQVYYDSANSLKMGYDIYEEVIQLGSERICQVHCKENKGLIGEGDVDFKKFHESLVTAGYDDWLIIEGSTTKGTDIVEAYRKNLSTLDHIFRN
ncbi:MAG: sugar phosphate isomerase/epimerase [Verrucomicrobiales bacterium]|nr:sugar phosphate isomerase/epimerase [Verrucomicrobiales bacterium]